MKFYALTTKKITLFLLLIAYFTTSSAQDAPESIVIGERLSLRSEMMDEDRPVWIYKPNSYENSGTSYPVLYLLDGPGHFYHTIGTIEFLVSRGQMPEILVVAIPNTNRTRDLTPPAPSDTTRVYPQSSGADYFLKFIGDELMPYIDKNYRTSPYSTLVGHSYGGLFVIHTLLTRPDLFDSYISISPSLQWDNGGLVPKAENLFENNPELKGKLYMTLGNEGGQMLGNVWRFAAQLEEKSPDTFEWEFALMENETHGSIPHPSTINGLKFIHSGYGISRFDELLEAGGITALEVHYKNLSDNYGYKIMIPENIINQFGYYCMGQGNNDAAIALFKRNVEMYPASANVYDSMGDGFDANDQPKDALKNYKKAVEVGTANADPNLGLYKDNLERMKKKQKAN